jgi:hypothetical protein
MSKPRNRTPRGRARLALFLLGLALALASVAYAVAETTRGPEPAIRGSGLAPSPSSELSIRVEPRTRSVAPGEVASFAVRIRNAKRHKVRLSVVGDFPRGATASLTPRRTRKSRATLTIDTGNARSGGHRLRLLARSGNRRATAAANLVITTPRGGDANFLIGGDLSGVLTPGLTEPIDLALTNPGSAEISIAELLVSIEGLTAPQADQTHPCTLEDFSVAQFSGAYGFTVGPSETSTLSALGFPEEQMPQVTMLDRPLNQNGCKGASLGFSYAGTATGGG